MQKKLKKKFFIQIFNTNILKRTFYCPILVLVRHMHLIYEIKLIVISNNVKVLPSPLIPSASMGETELNEKLHFRKSLFENDPSIKTFSFR